MLSASAFILLCLFAIGANLFVVYKLFEIEDYIKRRDRDDPQNAPTEKVAIRRVR
jgi:hypothetical protein